MNGKLLDTNILIYLSQKTLEFSKVASPGDNLYISVITYMEVLGYRFSNEFEQNFVEELCRNIPVIDLEKTIVEQVIQLRQLKKIKLPDAIILSTALVKNLELITANVNDFMIEGTMVVVSNPMK